MALDFPSSPTNGQTFVSGNRTWTYNTTTSSWEASSVATSKTANYVYAAPNGSAGIPDFRALVAADIPTLNQNTTGTAATITGVYSGTITSGQITTGLGFTPYNATNPNGYTSNLGTVTGVTGTAPIASSGGTAPTISISAATTSAAGSMSAADKTKLDGIATSANNYVLPKATASALGGVEVFDATVQTVAANAVTSTASRTYGVQLNSADQMVVNVPWTNSGGTFDGLTAKTSGTGTYQTSGDFRAPIFYDSNNTSFYLDPNGSSVLTNLTTTGRVTNAAGVKTYSITTVGQGNSNTTYEIMRISRDSANWSTNIPYEVTVYSAYYSSGGSTRWSITYGYGDTGTISCIDARGSTKHRVYLGTPVVVTGNISYIPVYVDIPNYYGVSIEVKYNTTEVSSFNGSAQVMFTGTYAAGTGSLYGGDIHLVPNGGNVGIGTASPTSLLNMYSATSTTLTMDGDTAVTLTLKRSSTNNIPPVILLNKARGTTSARTAVASGDAMGAVRFQAFGGTTDRVLATITGGVDTYVSDTNISSYFIFATTPAGTVSPVERMRIDSSGSVTASVDFRAPIFYDSNDTTYYVDPNSTTTSAYFAGNVTLPNTINAGIRNAAADAWLWVDDAYGNFYAKNASGGFYGDFTGYNFRSAGSVEWATMGASYFQHNTQLRSPIYYDSNDTAYYVDPNSTTNLNLIQANTYRQNASGVPRVNLGDPTITEMALFDGQFNNKTEFFPPANVICETSTDGTTWTTYSVTDAQKKLLVGGDGGASISIPNGTAYFRVRFINRGDYVYLNALYAYHTSGGHSTKVQIYKKDFGSTTWVQHTSSNASVGSWPGHIYLPFSTIAYHPGTYVDQVAVVFIPTWNNPTWSGQNITLHHMQIWGGYPAGKRNIYSVDSDKNVTFPSDVRATLFYDTNDTTYYVDPNSTSVMNAIQPWGEVGMRRGDSATLLRSYNTSASQATQFYVNHNLAAVEIGNARGIVYAGGSYWQIANSARAPIFYDSDDTARYVDPNSTSQIGSTYVNGYFQVQYNSGNQFAGMGIRNNYGSASAQSTTFIDFMNENGIQKASVFGRMATDGAGYLEFLSTAAGVSRSTDTRTTTAYAYSNQWSFQTSAGISTNIVYDRDNTAYYIDPASVSNINSLVTQGAISNNVSGLRNVNPAGGSYVTNASTVSGAIKIKLPETSYPMMRFTVRVYTYDGLSFDIYCGGHVSAGVWYNTFAYMTTQNRSALNVRFTYDGTNMYVIIGELAQSWTYPQVFITDVQVGYTNYEYTRWDDGWVISFETSTYHTVGSTHQVFPPTSSANNVNSAYASILYDSNNTGYYVDPNSTSNLYRTNGDGFAASQFLCGMTNYGDQVSASTWYGIGRSNVVGWTAGGMVQVAGYTGTRLRGAYSIIDIDGAVGGDLINFTTATARFTGDVRSTIFYDVSNTAYYIDPNAGGSNVFGEFKVNQNGAAGIQLISTTGTQSLWIRTGYDNAPTPSVSATNVQFQSSGSSGGSFTFWSGNTLALTITGDYAQGGGSLRAPIFYDSNNTAFYFDGASTTNINTMSGSGKTMFETADGYLRINQSSSFANGIWTGSSNLLNSTGILGWGSNGGTTNSRVYINGGTYNGTNVIALDGSNGRITASDIRAPIFYDTDNTGFFINPNGDTNLNRTFTYLGGKDTNANWNTGFQNTPAASYNYHGDLNGGTNAPAAGWWTYESRRHSNATNYWGTQVAWGWEDNANRMFQRNVTNGSFGGWVEYLNTSDRTYNGNLYMTGSIRSTSSDMRAPIFYDQDNTGYYTNPAGTSYINALNIGPTAAGSSYLNINGYNAYGGTGYHGFLTVSNTYGSATNPNQYWRINGAGGFEIVNSPYNAVLFTFTQGGDFTAAGNVTAYSDRKLKANFEPIENALSKVIQLNGVTFTRIDKEDLSKRYGGLIAQDVEAVLPEAVQINETISYGEVKSVDYNATIALLVEAIKEQQSHITKLEEKLNKLLGE